MFNFLATVRLDEFDQSGNNVPNSKGVAFTCRQ